MKTKEELEAKYKPIIEDSGIVVLDAIMHINHHPHPFTIGPKHVAYASDHCGGMLGDEVLKKIPCAAPRCGMVYEDHTYDTVAAMKLLRDAENEEVKSVLTDLIEAGLEEDGVDGFIFIETPEGFRVK